MSTAATRSAAGTTASSRITDSPATRARLGTRSARSGNTADWRSAVLPVNSWPPASRYTTDGRYLLPSISRTVADPPAPPVPAVPAGPIAAEVFVVPKSMASHHPAPAAPVDSNSGIPPVPPLAASEHHRRLL